VIAVDHSRPYAIHSASECERLERQAALAGIEHHLRFVPVRSGARVLDAGCGSGSMARLFAARHPHAQVTGIDLCADYLAYARERAAREGLRNLDFREGDIFRLPFPSATFDVVWSKYVLQWVKAPQAAITEFAHQAGRARRVLQFRRLRHDALAGRSGVAAASRARLSPAR
jgi:ubiquinone/menaquinone biosynthesis C-methylase UbiE